MWDQRYATDEYIFGTQPARFLERHGDLLTPGQHALSIADGEGRNAVFMARKGLRVTAFDASQNAISKARKLATEHQVELDLQLADIDQWAWSANTYDVVVGVFFQFAAPQQRAAIFEGIKTTLKPGGLVLLHGYRPEQLEYATGGPPHRENMYTEALLREAFADFDIQLLRAYDEHINEGSGHVGMSALIDLVARKPGATLPIDEVRS